MPMMTREPYDHAQLGGAIPFRGTSFEVRQQRVVRYKGLNESPSVKLGKDRAHPQAEDHADLEIAITYYHETNAFTGYARQMMNSGPE